VAPAFPNPEQIRGGRIGILVFPVGREISSEFCRLAAFSAFSSVNSCSNSKAPAANSLPN